jgi:hypothetical protein
MRNKPRITFSERHNEYYPPSEIQAEIDAHDRFVADVRDYVNDCVENAIEPSGYVFCVMERIDYGGEGGTAVEALIAKMYVNPADIRDYVNYCRHTESAPDAFAFSTTYRAKYGYVPGALINALLTKEWTRNERC